MLIALTVRTNLQRLGSEGRIESGNSEGVDAGFQVMDTSHAAARAGSRVCIYEVLAGIRRVEGGVNAHLGPQDAGRLHHNEDATSRMHERVEHIVIIRTVARASGIIGDD